MVVTSNCAPVPANTANTSGRAGGRKTSACTNFHPYSSKASSFSSSVATLLYRLKSRCKLFDKSVTIMELSTAKSTNDTIVEKM
eukprot:scaffold34680_cov183-Amphora_coffeaeformis.AAC.2